MSIPEAPTGPRRTLLYVVLAVLVVAVLAVAALFFLRPATEDAATSPPPVVQERPSPTPSETPQSLPGDATFAVFEARDPFEQLVQDDGAGEEGATSDAAGGSGDPTSGSTDGSPPPFSAPPSGATPTPAPTGQVAGTTIELVDIYPDGEGRQTAQITVNGTGYDVRAGESFAGGDGSVEAVDPPCATIVYDDNRLHLCEGEVLRK